jgi:tetratricopeptide (TPR) repeat protein
MAPGSRLQELTAKYMQNPRRFFVPLANEYRIAGDLDRAIALCREHLPAQPGHMSGHIVLGRAYFEKGDHDAARDVFLTSVALDDENLIALRHLGDIARLRSESTEARGWYARVLDADPENGEIERLLRELGPATDPLATVGPADAGSVPQPLPSALDDPTPPGLRAILGDDAEPPFDAGRVRVPDPVPPSPSRPLETFDLASFGTPDDGGITVEGAGFGFGDLDELVDPTAAGAMPDALPPLEETDFTTGVETPTASAVTPPPDDLLSRPVFGALASFASWRTAQERDTPSAGPVVGPSAPTLSGAEAADAGDDGEDRSRSTVGEAAETAPEFVTETMAALYAQQGFTRQALDVYRALLERSPADAGLTMKVIELQRALESPAADAVLEDDADKALQFGDLEDSSSSRFGSGAAPESSVDNEEALAGDPLKSAFGTAWTASTDPVAAGDDDWFAEANQIDPVESSVEAAFDLFGVSIDGFDLGPADVTAPASAAPGALPGRSLVTVFDAATVAVADESAGQMLEALAAQMVGRLPKEPPTLPVPDILELPSAMAADEATGTTAAPLLSFDRFFSGSGSPPRQRIDTPARPASPAGARAASDLPASLSPTFGGVPVIPPSGATPAPAWPGFDQFLLPTVAGEPLAPTSPSVTPSSVFWTPAVVPAIPPAPPTAATPVDAIGAATPVPDAPPPRAAQPVDDAALPSDEGRRAPPSDFHRWLEGLS